MLVLCKNMFVRWSRGAGRNSNTNKIIINNNNNINNNINNNKDNIQIMTTMMT